jgi:hypothetical protein
VAVEVSTLLDREGHVMDVGFNVTGGLQGNRLSTDDARDSAAHDDLLARDHSRHLSFLTDDDLGCPNVTFNLTIDLQAAAANDLEPPANNLEIVAYDRLLAARRRADRRLRPIGTGRVGRADVERFGLDRRVTREHENPPKSGAASPDTSSTSSFC